jgi:tellurite resistance protein
MPPAVAAVCAASDAGTERSPHFVNSMAIAAAIIARADGRSDPIERREFIAYARRSLSRTAIRRWNVSILFDERIGELERNPNRIADLLSALDVVAGTPRAWIVLRTAERVATVDGDVDEAEITSLAAIRCSLGIPSGIRERFVACML